jgi:hypothetical protein
MRQSPQGSPKRQILETMGESGIARTIDAQILSPYQIQRLLLLE